MWTKEQQIAISSSGKNIIVSAGAGSGKTAVLTTRIIEKLKNGVDINSLLVLTFTKAAASEMKERIRKSLIEIGGFEKSLNNLDQAYITTFDAFSLAMVNKYFYKLNIKPGISIADSLIIERMKRNIINEVLAEHYEADDKQLHDFLKKFTSKDDTKLVQLIYTSLMKVDLKPNTLEFLAQYMETHFSATFIDEMVSRYEKTVLIECQNLEVDVVNLYDVVDDGKLREYLGQMRDELKNITDYKSALRVISAVKLPPVPRGSSDELKSLKEDLSKNIKNFNESILIYEDTSQMVEGVLLSMPTTDFLVTITKECYLRILDYKKSIDYYEFIDVAKMAIKLVSEFEDVAKEIKTTYSEILIDEYQDTSDLQEAFIERIANDNLYMVGDIKQSIYRFRNANPYIFKDKYARYSCNNGGMKIDLNKNFRSRNEVLQDINLIFNELMTEQYGDASYKQTHQMSFGFEPYDKHNGGINHHFQLFSYKMDKDNKNYSPAEVEAFIIADDILKKMKNYQIYDKDKKSLRTANYGDFCILVDKTTHFETIKRIFEYKAIPLAINADNDLSNSILSKIICHGLNLVAKTKEKKFDASYYHSFSSVARSFIMEYSDEEIYRYVLTKNQDNEIADKILALSTLIDEKPISEIYFQMLASFDICKKLVKIGNINDSLVQLEYLNNMIIKLEQLGYSFNEMASYLGEILADENKISYSVLQNSANCVRIMTIHKSKGLEFPICYFPLLHVKFNIKDITDSFSYSNKYGFICPIDQDGLEKTITHRVAYRHAMLEEISEHIRLLYVAVTRAKEQFILVNQQQNYSLKFMRPENFMSFGHFLFSLENILLEYNQNIDINNLSLTKDYLNTNKIAAISEGKKILHYEMLKVEQNKLNKSKISKSLNHIIDAKTKKNIDVGLEFHEALEALDFNKMNVDELEVSDFVKEKLKIILTNPLFANIMEAKTYHEHEFETIIESEKYHGIIDLLVVYPNHIDIIDYKLANLNHAEYYRQLSIYKKYVRQKSNLVVNVYLLAVLTAEVVKIED